MLSNKVAFRLEDSPCVFMVWFSLPLKVRGFVNRCFSVGAEDLIFLKVVSAVHVVGTKLCRYCCVGSDLLLCDFVFFRSPN